jgi:NAD(P)-dependent dehydrogenase (short-subunit alcohol dehydrogenase family)
MELTGKKALVTGSRRGIGRAIAVALAQAGCDIGLNDVERDAEAEKTLAMIEGGCGSATGPSDRGHGRKATFTVADTSKAAEVDRLFTEFLAAHGRIDILVNNAYWAQNLPFLEITEEVWDRTMEVCLKGYFLCAQRAARAMVRQGGGGSIVSIASVHASRAWPNDTAYGVAKAAVVRLTMSMALDLAGTGIRCNAVAPGWIDSRVLPPEREAERGVKGYGDYAVPSIPSRRIGVPEDIARLVLFLCTPMSDYIHGTCITADGGFLVGGTPGV